MEDWEGSPRDYLTNPKLNEIRHRWNQMIWPKECSACEKVESDGAESRRLSSLRWLNDNGIFDDSIDLVRMDYWCGNVCNLRCATCGPHNSTAWQKELGVDKDARNTVVNHSWRDCDLSKLQWIHFNGGEPLLDDHHIDLISSHPNLSKLKLNYNTNATVKPRPELIDIWSRCELVVLDLSLDGIGDRFEYLRFPANWETVIKNLFWMRDNLPVNVMFEVNATISVLNQHYQDEVKTWIQDNFATNRVTDPVRYRSQPANGILSIDADITRATVYLDSLDAKRNTDWRSVFPAFADQAASASTHSR